MEVNIIIRNDSLKRLTVNLLVLYFFNISDLLFTKYLITTAPDLFLEANIFLNPIVNGLEIYFLKVVVFALALLYWWSRSKKSTYKQLRRSLLVSKVFLGLYMGINLLHLYNFIILIRIQ